MAAFKVGLLSQASYSVKQKAAFCIIAFGQSGRSPPRLRAGAGLFAVVVRAWLFALLVKRVRSPFRLFGAGRIGVEPASPSPRRWRVGGFAAPPRRVAASPPPANGAAKQGARALL